MGLGALLGILVFAVLASIINPQNFLNNAGKSLEVVKHNPNQESVPKKANAEVEFKRTDQRITIQHGATIYKIAIDAYGANTVLGMDLIKEFNPEIENLNWVCRRARSPAPFLNARNTAQAATRWFVSSHRCIIS